LKVGTVISNKHGLCVITKVTNNTVVDTEPLNEFISKNVVLQHNGESKTIKEIIEFYCDDYLSKTEIIDK
jgi:hypothetical protein